MSPPSSWLLDNAHLLPLAGRALDVACGEGRHALWLASRGLETRAVDRDREKLEALRAAAQRLGLRVETDLVDLEAGSVDLVRGAYALIVVVNYLERALFPALQAALAPGGVLVYETFTLAQAARGRPRNPAFLLKPGELGTLVAPLEILRAREGEFDGKSLASVVARRAG